MTEQIHIEISRTTRTVVSGKWIFLTQTVPAQPAEKDNSHGNQSDQGNAADDGQRSS